MTQAPSIIPVLEFDHGSLVVQEKCWNESWEEQVGHFFTPDPRTGQRRALGMHYADIVKPLFASGSSYQDEAKAFLRLNFKSKTQPPRPYQQEAVNAWLKNQGQGVVVLPTGAGKSLVAMLAIQKVERHSLVLVPTLDLLTQWQQILSRAFECEVGMIGGGSFDIKLITVSTYDSASIHMPRLGNRFGLLIADECHHLPSPSYQWIAKSCLAPFRLGLSATPDRSDGGHLLLDQLLGPVVYRAEISTFEGEYLSPYETQQIMVPLKESEMQAYKKERKVFLDFAKEKKVSFNSPQAWSQFVALCFRSKAGKEAYSAYRRQKDLLRCSRSKLEALWELLLQHQNDKCLLFTDDNATAYRIGQDLCLPVLTHHTKAAERKRYLEMFRQGLVNCLVTSRVLNEGVDVPEANVGIIISGTGSVREHVQRLGRILRKVEGKAAYLYELISENTSEYSQSERRRNHDAYQRSD